MLGNFNSSIKPSSLSPVKNREISPTDFHEWASQNMYRSSYRDMYKKSPAKAKSYAIPGYSGHIPGTSADTNYGKRFALVTREQFSREKYLPARQTELFPKRPTSLSPTTTGYGRFGGGVEDEYHTVSRYHGKSTIPMTHPNYTAADWSTNYKNSYKKQEELRPVIFRTTDLGFWKSSPINDRKKTQASGFVQNSTLFDGHGWLPIKKLHGDLTYSEYRNRFNPDVKFHPPQLKSNARRMHRKQLVY